MYQMKVKDMTCGHCKARVTQALMGVDPDALVEVDLKHQQVRVESACDLPELTDALAAAGYPATQVSTGN